MVQVIEFVLLRNGEIITYKGLTESKSFQFSLERRIIVNTLTDFKWKMTGFNPVKCYKLLF